MKSRANEYNVHFGWFCCFSFDSQMVQFSVLAHCLMLARDLPNAKPQLVIMLAITACNCAVRQLVAARELAIEIRLSVTGAQLKCEILRAAVNHSDVISDVISMKLITSGRVIDDNVSLEQQQLRVTLTDYL